MERQSFKQAIKANRKLIDLNKEAKKMLDLVKETALQMESELRESSHITVQELHFGKVYAGMYKGSLMLFSNFEFEQYLIAYAGLAEITLLPEPCPATLVKVEKAFVMASHPCEADKQKPFVTRFVMAFVPMSNPTLDSEDWGDVLLNKTSAANILAKIDRETIM